MDHVDMCFSEICPEQKLRDKLNIPVICSDKLKKKKETKYSQGLKI